MMLGYSMRELSNGYVEVGGSMHGKYRKDVVAEAISTHARLVGGPFVVTFPNGKLVERPSLPDMNKNLGSIVQ